MEPLCSLLQATTWPLTARMIYPGSKPARFHDGYWYMIFMLNVTRQSRRLHKPVFTVWLFGMIIWFANPVSGQASIQQDTDRFSETP